MRMQELVDLGEWNSFGDIECDMDGCTRVAKKFVRFYLDSEVYHLCKDHGHQYLEALRMKRVREAEGIPTSFIVNRGGLYTAEQQFEETDIP